MIRRQFKVCLIGDGYVGKTSVRRKYLKEGFKRSYIPTLGVDFAQKSLLFEGTPTNLVIWDIAGQVAFQNLRRRYYEGASGIILIFAVDDRKSFDNATKWLVEAHGFMGELPPLMIVANKTDLRDTLRQQDMITTEEGQAFVEDVSRRLGTNAVYFETSAKTGKNIDETFEELVRMMIESLEQPVKSQEVSHEAAGANSSAEATTQTPPSVTPAASTPTPTNEPATEPTSPTPQTSVAPEQVEEQPPKEIDPVTLLPSDSELLQEDMIARAMTELQDLRSQLKLAEENLAQTLSDIERELLTLKNTVHVKRIMFEHLKEQLKNTREEWADAYEKYQGAEKRRKETITEQSKQIEEIKRKIEETGARVRTHVSDLSMKKMSEF